MYDLSRLTGSQQKPEFYLGTKGTPEVFTEIWTDTVTAKNGGETNEIKETTGKIILTPFFLIEATVLAAYETTMLPLDYLYYLCYDYHTVEIEINNRTGDLITNVEIEWCDKENRKKRLYFEEMRKYGDIEFEIDTKLDRQPDKNFGYVTVRYTWNNKTYEYKNLFRFWPDETSSREFDSNGETITDRGGYYTKKTTTIFGTVINSK